MPKLSQPIMAALAELHHARAAKVARTPGYARRLRNAVLDGSKAIRAALLCLAQPLNCAAIFYRDANRGDAVGYYQWLADALESAGVLSNDKWIVQWDGSRLAKDAKRPRIEVTLTALVGE